jgi:tRNA(Ile)-lysidine synthase TilS/MesJ
MRLCREHFEEDVHRKIREELRRTGLFGREARLVVGLDGSRKSAAIAFILKDLFRRRRDISLLAIIIDEGEGTTPASSQAAEVAEELGVACRVLKMPSSSELNAPHAIRSREKIQMLIKAAEENQAGVLVTGETLEDEAGRIFLCLLQGDVDSAIQTCAEKREDAKERSEEQAVAVARIKPLQRIPEREVRLYALGRHLGLDDAGDAAEVRGQRWAAKMMLCDFDCRHPGTCYSLLRGMEKIRHLRAETGAKPLSKDGKGKILAPR